MADALPSEILDLVIDQLCDDPTALKACCSVSKSWIPRARMHLFESIDFYPRPSINAWMKAFPDPSRSPAHYTRSIWLPGQTIEPLANVDASSWFRSFTRLEHLGVNASRRFTTGKISLVTFCGLSPTLRSLDLAHVSIPLPEVVDLICSFPLLEDLSVNSGLQENNTDQYHDPPTSPRFTGTLHIRNQVRPIGRYLLRLPGGLHFTKVEIRCDVKDADVMMELISSCSHTLEHLSFCYYPHQPRGTEPPVDLSKIPKLKSVEFRLMSRSVLWVAMSLRTLESKKLRHITLFTHTAFETTWEQLLREWQDLDHLLAQLWTSHLIIPKVKCQQRDDGKGLDAFLTSLLPELVERGVICEVVPYTPSRISILPF